MTSRRSLPQVVFLVLGVGALVLGISALALSLTTRAAVDRFKVPESASFELAKVVEAQVAVTEIAWGIALCAEREQKLPPSSAAIPALEKVKGKIYQSGLTDWNDPALSCAGFHMTRPQRFQYRWTQSGERSGGVVQAEADFDGDGAVDHEVRLKVRCEEQEQKVRCRADPMPTDPLFVRSRP